MFFVKKYQNFLIVYKNQNINSATKLFCTLFKISAELLSIFSKIEDMTLYFEMCPPAKKMPPVSLQELSLLNDCIYI